GSSVTLDAQIGTPFPDDDLNAWYYPYVHKAYAEGWVVGYPDGTFKPEQTVNKVEALKIVAEVQNWATETNIQIEPFFDVEIEQWFITYVDFAKKANYLEEDGAFFNPGEDMTRAKISEIIFRTLNNQTTTTEEVVVVEEPEEAEETQIETQLPTIDEFVEELTLTVIDESDETITPEEYDEDFVPNSFKMIDSEFYKNIILTEDIPNTFYKDEVFIIEGSLNDKNEDFATVILGNATDSNDYQTFIGETDNGDFAIPIYMPKPGNYHLGLTAGQSGTSIATSISVLSNLPDNADTVAAPGAATNLKANFWQDTSYIELTSSQSSVLNRITFTQGSKTATVISRQEIEDIPLEYTDYKNFTEGTVEFYIETAKLADEDRINLISEFKKSSSSTFLSTTHHFSQIDKTLTSATPVDLLNSSISTINFSGNLSTEAKVAAFVINPKGMVEDVELQTNNSSDGIISSGGNFTFNYTTSGKGTYIVEVNDSSGLAIINHPIYVNNGIPLIPDYFDLNPRTLYGGNFNLQSARQELLDEINASRKAHGLNEVILSEELNELSQEHSQDMFDNDFFGHVNPEGLSPNDRRLAAGIKTSVGENLSRDVNIKFSHEGLMRSAGHRKNILTADWKRVGIGIVENNGYLLATEEFSTFESTADDIAEHRAELLDSINIKRKNNGDDKLAYIPELNASAKYINDLIIQENATLTNEIFSTALSENGITGASQALIRSFNIWTDILTSILEDDQVIFESDWVNLGVDIQLDDTGSITTTIIINK
ncbi:S-layer homology domain-containing protein, partial [Candidatus Gracilibacteria bacterium]|nr:S-layer homology domain-containing protein [Candidatus Gracilibacteria bacterium]